MPRKGRHPSQLKRYAFVNPEIKYILSFSSSDATLSLQENDNVNLDTEEGCFSCLGCIGLPFFLLQCEGELEGEKADPSPYQKTNEDASQIKNASRAIPRRPSRAPTQARRRKSNRSASKDNTRDEFFASFVRADSDGSF